MDTKELQEKILKEIEEAKEAESKKAIELSKSVKNQIEATAFLTLIKSNNGYIIF
jgi:hypothetical protein